MIADQRMSFFREMHADLIPFPGQKVDFHQTKAFILFKHRISGAGQFAFNFVAGRMHHVFLIIQKTGYLPLFFFKLSGNNRPILFLILRPIIFKKFLCFEGFGKNHDPGGILIQAVHHKNAIMGAGVAFTDILIKRVMRGVNFFMRGADRQNTGSLVADDNIPVFVKDAKTFGLMTAGDSE